MSAGSDKSYRVYFVKRLKPDGPAEKHGNVLVCASRALVLREGLTILR